jgi:serine-type D-Ala-D-Ala carboxypeptidase (penicillin-binding protein 5/6)
MRPRAFVQQSHCCGKNELLMSTLTLAPHQGGAAACGAGTVILARFGFFVSTGRAWSALLVAAGVATAAILAVAGALAAPNGMAVAGKTDFQTSAPSAILIDAGTGTVLFEKNADVPMAPSSMAKLMTSEVVFNEIVHNRIKLDDEYVVSEDAWRRGGAPSHTSSMFAPIHSRVRVEDLLQGAIVQSGNDACIALAEGIAGNEPAFVEMMNARAHELGMTRSYFTNATGLPDPAQKVTVRELAGLARHIIRTYPNFYHIYGEHEFIWNKIRQQNRNPLLTMNIGADGLKTGFTQDGGYGLVGSVVQNDLRLIVVVNGLKTAKDRAEEAKKLVEFGFRGFDQRSLFPAGEVVGYARLFGGASLSVGLVGEGAIGVLMPKNSQDRLAAKIVYSGPVPAPVRSGQPIGKLQVYRGNNVIAEAPLFAAEPVARGTLSRRAFDAVSELVIGLFRFGPKKL